MNRRMLLRLLALTGVLTSLAACAPGAAPPATSPPAPTKPSPAAAATGAPAPTTAAPAPTQAPPKPKTLRSVSVRLDWTPFGYHAPFWAAVEQGYFAQNGLDVQVLDGKGSQQTLQLVAAGQATSGFLDAGVLIQGVQKGIDVRMVGCPFQKNAFGIISPADAPIDKPEDIIGKRLAGVPTGAGETMFPVFARKTGIPESSMTLVNSDTAGIYAAVMARKVDGAFHQVPTAAATYAAQNFPIHTLLYADFGVARLGLGVALLNRTIQESPDMVRGLLAAIAKGWQLTVENPTKAIEGSRKVVDTTTPTETLVSQWKALLPFARTERTKDKPLFWMDGQDWEDTQAVMFDTGALTEKRPVNAYFANEYINQT